MRDFLLEGLEEKWPVSMVTTDTIPFLLTAKQLQMCSHGVDSADCYWIHLLQKDAGSDVHTPEENEKDQSACTDCRGQTDTRDAACVASDKSDRMRSKGADSLRPACSLDVDPEGEDGLYVLRPSLLPHMEDCVSHRATEANDEGAEVEGNNKDESCGSCNGVTSPLFSVSGLVFKSVAINIWSLPAFHELLLRGVFPSQCEPITSLGQRLETLLAPYGVSLVSEQGGLRLVAQPMGLVGKVLVSTSDNISHVSITVSLNLDLLAVLFFSLPDWRLLWSHDPRFLKQFERRPSPGTSFHPFSLFPEHFSFDISFWTGPTWEEKKFHAMVREASHGTVEQVKLIDSFSHPDLSQTSYCYRLTYHSHTHALSHTQALKFHKHLESLLSSRLHVTIR